MPQQSHSPYPAAPGIEPERLADLRLRAAARLADAAATHEAPARAVDALAVLHALASSPDTAPDALALLHELQVHQIELDLQAQELRESRAELESALRRQIELYDFQPVGSFTVDARTVVHELNQTGADMLGIGRDDAEGLALDAFLCSESASRIRLAVARVDAGAPRAACRLTLRPQDRPERPVVAIVGKDPAANRYLLSLVVEDEEEALRPAQP